MNCRIFQLLATESPFESYMSKRILFFAYLMFSSVSGAKALKKTSLQFAIFNSSENLRNGIKKYGVIVQKSLLKKSI